MHQHANFCQNWSIGCDDIKIFLFLRWRPLPSYVFEIVKFYLLTVCGGPRLITVPNFVKIGRVVAEILQFSNFQDDRHCHLVFLKSRTFIGYWGPEVRDALHAKCCQNW